MRSFAIFLAFVFTMALAGLTQSAVAQTGAGELTTHVLDLTKGKPGGGVKVALYVIEGGQKRLLKTAVTNRDGRTDGPMLAGQAFHAGRYELVFSVGDYFRSQGMETSDPGFLDEVPIAFGISDPSQHYHVPLVVSPWAYSTYRGS